MSRAQILDASRSRVAEQAVLQGGPVQTERGFVLHSPSGRYESSLPFSERMHLTTSRDILDALAAGEGPDTAVIALGYAGWDAALGREILDGGASLESLGARVADGGIDPRPVSGRQEYLENLVNQRIWASGADASAED
mgnify:CR=1 FL=1